MELTNGEKQKFSNCQVMGSTKYDQQNTHYSKLRILICIRGSKTASVVHIYHIAVKVHEVLVHMYLCVLKEQHKPQRRSKIGVH